MQIVQSEGQVEMEVKVGKGQGNSVTTHMRSVGKKIWPLKKEAITVYTARHAMASDCKAAVDNGASKDLVSQVLGHIVDKTATYYGTRFHSGKGSVAPSEIVVPKPIKHIYPGRSVKRKTDGTMQALIAKAKDKKSTTPKKRSYQFN